MKVKVQTYIDAETFAAITQLCKLYERTVSNMAAILLREAVAAEWQVWRKDSEVVSLHTTPKDGREN